MQRAVAHYPTREIAFLGVVEFVLSFSVIYLVIGTVGADLPRSDVFEMLRLGLPARTMALAGAMALAAALTLVTSMVALTTGLYRLEVCVNRKALMTVTGLVAMTVLAILVLISQRPGGGFAGGATLFMPMVLAAWLATMTLIRLAYGFAMRRMTLTRRVLLIGKAGEVGAVGGRLRSHPSWMFDPVVLPGQVVSWQLLRAHRIWGVVITSSPDRAMVETLMDSKLRGMRIFSGAAFHENYLGRIDLDTIAPNDVLTGQGYAASRLSAVLKRACDVLIGGALLFLTLPLMALTALMIGLDSPGPVLYRQQRVGQFDQVFTLLKFRSMTVDAEAGGDPRWAQKHDPRVTRAGRFIRATRIDELPQLANILRGEMSLVGPRPERPHFVEQLARAIPLYRHRGYVKPGLTGWAQVKFPYGASVEDAREKLAYDLYYVKNRSIMLDVIILISTIRVVLFREGAR